MPCSPAPWEPYSVDMGLRKGHQAACCRTRLVDGAVRLGREAGGVRLLVVAGLSLLVTACASGGGSAASDSAHAASGSVTRAYQLLLDFYAAESGSRVYPMMFVPAPRARAAVGPLMVRHVAGITPARHSTPPATELLGADGSHLGITFRRWQQARGTATFRCVDSKEQVTSKLTDLIPSGTYSTFAVHTSVQGP